MLDFAAHHDPLLGGSITSNKLDYTPQHCSTIKARAPQRPLMPERRFTAETVYSNTYIKKVHSRSISACMQHFCTSNGVFTPCMLMLRQDDDIAALVMQPISLTAFDNKSNVNVARNQYDSKGNPWFGKSLNSVDYPDWGHPHQVINFNAVSYLPMQLQFQASRSAPQCVGKSCMQDNAQTTPESSMHIQKHACSCALTDLVVCGASLLVTAISCHPLTEHER